MIVFVYLKLVQWFAIRVKCPIWRILENFQLLNLLQTNMFIINLALSDMGIMLTQGPLMFINAFYSDYWMWGSLLCKIYGCTGGIFGKTRNQNVLD